MRRRSSIALLALVLLAAGQAKAQPIFAPTACDLPNLTAAIRPRLRCGTIDVPRDYADPAAGHFALAVVVIASARQPALPEPVVSISGGPGSPLTVYTYAQAVRPFATDRDLILVDQRGTGRSQPQICPDHAPALTQAVVSAAIDPAHDGRPAAYAACRAEALAAGIAPRDFGTTVTVEDFETVRRALGITRWNLFGVSYGTTVAMTLMALHPGTIRSAVLDSVYPPDPLLPPWSVNVADAQASFLDAHPGLTAIYQATVDQLRHAPAMVAMPPGLPGAGRPVKLTAGLFQLVVGHMVYYPNFYAALPRLISTMQAGDTTAFAAALATLVTAATDPATGTSLAALAAVDCRDRPRFRAPLAADANVFERSSLYGECATWSTLGPPPLVPLDTPVPTLVLAGQFDPNARPDASRHVAALIGARAQWVAFPGLGHSVRAFSACARGVVAAFIAAPERLVDAGCAAEAKTDFSRGNDLAATH